MQHMLEANRRRDMGPVEVQLCPVTMYFVYWQAEDLPVMPPPEDSSAGRSAAPVHDHPSAAEESAGK